MTNKYYPNKYLACRGSDECGAADEIERFRVLKKACEHWMAICGCCGDEIADALEALDTTEESK